MSIYTCVKKEVVEVLNRDLFCGTYVLRMEPIYAEVSAEQWYDAMERGEPIDQVYEVAEQQVRYWIWGPDITRGIVFEVQEDGSLFTANRTDAIEFAEFLIVEYGDMFYKEHVSHDNDCYWDLCRQQWVGIALDSGAMYTPLDDVDYPVQRYCDEQQGDIVEDDVFDDDDDDYDDDDDVDRYGSDGHHTEGYEEDDPGSTIGGDVCGHHVDRLIYVTDDHAGRSNLIIIDSGEIDEGNGSFTWINYVKGVCDPSAGYVDFFIVYEDDLGRISETFLSDDDPRIAKCSYVINIDGDIPF